MTNGNFEYRLDQVETIAAILVTHVEAIDSRLEQVTTKLDGLTSNVDTLAALMAQQIHENELDRQQAAADRAQVRSLVEALTQRFSSNGHS
ncbi:MAG: hypothetical protein HC769_21705 [Cyanobacteria bacterium CRU_2_1]|nr:hypothetical protein [Cyanobacteria bacterium CRU_2_1]